MAKKKKKSSNLNVDLANHLMDEVRAIDVSSEVGSDSSFSASIYESAGGGLPSRDEYEGLPLRAPPPRSDGPPPPPREDFEVNATAVLDKNDETAAMAQNPHAGATGVDYTKNIGGDDVKTFNSRTIPVDVAGKMTEDSIVNIFKKTKPQVDQKNSMQGKPLQINVNLQTAESALVQSEHLRMAQSKIASLEVEIEKQRSDNDELMGVGQVLKIRVDELLYEQKQLEKAVREVQEEKQEAVGRLNSQLQSKDKELSSVKEKNKELQARLNTDLKKIKFRERDLENRLELMRIEKMALVRSKDETILEMKRLVDQLKLELNNYRSTIEELNKTIDSNQDQFKRTVRALRLALSNLEIKNEDLQPLKKAE